MSAGERAPAKTTYHPEHLTDRAAMLATRAMDRAAAAGGVITTLPDNLEIGGSLDLRGTGVTKLPDNLSVGGNLYLNRGWSGRDGLVSLAGSVGRPGSSL
jgi:2-succinyl-5-enolpyruvyl-6-hydroxy-3-cyclohexene-1-carboxylate synthase